MCSKVTNAEIENNSVNSKPFSFIEIFEQDIDKDGEKVKANCIVIPKIQRDYAQGRQNPKVERIRDKFLDSLYGAITGKPIILDFVFGDLNSNNNIMTPLDGQQRLTTLFLLHWYAARKEKIPRDECSALEKFSYETRYSARDFCTELAKFIPAISCIPQNENALSKLIIDQRWFPLEWKKDPTISSMLVMLDAINDKFGQVTNIWQSLKDGAIRFYFLALTDIGLTDELYIKMNSRGKALTLFENFKADLDGFMRQADPLKAKRIMKKIDGVWNDLLWNYCKKDTENAENAIPDNEFLNYFKFICLLIHYRDNTTRFQRDEDVLDMLKLYFSGDHNEVNKNIDVLENAFDCWCNLPNKYSPAEFLNDYLSINHQKDKIIVSSKYGTDIFNECIKSERITLGTTVLLYAIVVYLQNYNSITDDDFRTRLRCINNLIQNSEDELAERSDNSRMKNILNQTYDIMMNGNIDVNRTMSFNIYQLEEEKAKNDHLKNNPADKDNMFLLEDHPLLYGQIGIIGLNNLNKANRFYSLFKCDRDLISCALMTIGDYGQLYSNGWRWIYGSLNGDKSWKEMFHRSSSRKKECFNNTHNILNLLLNKSDVFDNSKLNAIIYDFITDCNNKSEFPWRYYFVRYDVFRPFSYGMYSTKDTFIASNKENYMKKAMQTQTFESVYTYLPFNVCQLDRKTTVDENTRIFLGNNYIENYNDCFKLFDKNLFTAAAGETPLIIPQNNAGIDTVDRIELLKKQLNNSWKNK